MANLQETTFCEAKPSIDREAGVIRRVRILGRESRNGRTYSDQALKQAARLYEGVRVNFDHPDRSKPGNSERKFGDFVGQLDNCVVDMNEGAVYGDLNILKSHERSEVVFESAERFPRSFGLSHNAEGECTRKDGKQVVESVSTVNSVDIVTQPATNQGLYESEDTMPDQPKTKNVTLKQILESATAETEPRKQLAKLLEMDAAAGEMTMDVPAEAADPNEDVKQALKKAAAGIVGKMLDGDIDKSEGLKKLRELLGMGEKLGAEKSGDAAPEPPAEVAESLRKMQADMDRLHAKNLLLESGREASDAQVAAVAAVPEADRKALVESWPAKDASPGGRGKPPASKPKQIRESGGDDRLQESWKRRVDANRKKLEAKV